MGIPFYGVQWRNGGISSPSQHWNSTPSLNQVDYNKIVPQINAQNYRWDSTAQVPYLSNNAGVPSYLSYDDEQSVAAKVNYAKTMGLGGWAIWHLSLDYFPHGSPQHPLMEAIRNASARRDCCAKCKDLRTPSMTRKAKSEPRQKKR
jgi:GH18 family chitinase